LAAETPIPLPSLVVESEWEGGTLHTGNRDVDNPWSSSFVTGRGGGVYATVAYTLHL
jgi:hypothetical protein